MRYSSPAASALSVLSMPPMIVTSANGSAIDRYGSVSRSASSHASVGHGIARPSGASVVAPDPQPSAARAQKIAAADEHGGERAGDAQRHPHAAERGPAAARPGRPGRPAGRGGPSASAGTRSASIATPAIEPRSAARGHDPPDPVAGEGRAPAWRARWRSSRAMPTFQASTGSPVASFTGPSTPNTIAKRVGVSMPKGIAVTSVRPVRRMRRTASHVYARSPTSTPSAVPGTIRCEDQIGGKPKTPISRPTRMTSWWCCRGRDRGTVDVAGREPAGRARAIGRGRRGHSRRTGESASARTRAASAAHHASVPAVRDLAVVDDLGSETVTLAARGTRTPAPRDRRPPHDDLHPRSSRLAWTVRKFRSHREHLVVGATGEHARILPIRPRGSMTSLPAGPSASALVEAA